MSDDCKKIASNVGIGERHPFLCLHKTCRDGPCVHLTGDLKEYA
jgi:hypothetical protein